MFYNIHAFIKVDAHTKTPYIAILI